MINDVPVGLWDDHGRLDQNSKTGCGRQSRPRDSAKSLSDIGAKVGFDDKTFNRKQPEEDDVTWTN